MAVEAPITLAMARNSRRFILPALALSASDRIAAGTRSPLLLNMVILPSPVVYLSAFTIPHLSRVVKDQDEGNHIRGAPVRGSVPLRSPPALGAVSRFRCKLWLTLHKGDVLKATGMLSLSSVSHASL